IVRAIFARQYNAMQARLYELRNRLQQESPQLVEESGFAYAIDVMKSYPAISQKAVLRYPSFSFWLDVAFELVRRHSNLIFPEMHIYQHLQEFWRFVFAVVLHAKKGALSCSILTDAEGRIAFPGTGTYFQTNAPIAHQRLVMRVCDGDVTAYNPSDSGEAQV